MTEEIRLVGCLLYLWVQIKRKQYSSNKILNLAGHTMKCDPLIIAHIPVHILTERQDQ